MARLSTAFSVFLVACFQCHCLNGAFAQYLVEVLETTTYGNYRPVSRCNAQGADFGEDVLPFSFRVPFGCAVPTVPSDACSDVAIPPPSNGSVSCSTMFAVVPRSNCSFSEKAYHVQNSKPTRFSALIMYNTKGKEAESMSGAKYHELVTIPVVMVDYDCMQALLYRFNYHDGHVVTIKVTPGYYDLLKYLVPFGAVISFCLTLLLISLIIRVCRERRRLARKRLSRSNLKKLPLVKYKKNAGMYETCAVCLEDFIEDEKLRQLPCRHAYHMKCIDPWLTKNRKVCPICKRKVGPSNGSDSSDSDSERTAPTTTTSTSGAIVANGSSTTRDSMPLLNYEQPTATSSNSNLTSTSGPHGPFRSSGFLNLTRLSNEAAGLPPRASIEDVDPVQNADVEHRPSRGINRLFDSARALVRRVTRAEFNPHTILDNDFASVSEEDPERASTHSVILEQPTTSMMSADSRSVILEPLPPRIHEPIRRQPSNDSEIEVLAEDAATPPSPSRSTTP